MSATSHLSIMNIPPKYIDRVIGRARRQIKALQEQFPHNNIYFHQDQQTGYNYIVNSNNNFTKQDSLFTPQQLIDSFSQQNKPLKNKKVIYDPQNCNINESTDPEYVFTAIQQLMNTFLQKDKKRLFKRRRRQLQHHAWLQRRRIS